MDHREVPARLRAHTGQQPAAAQVDDRGLVEVLAEERGIAPGLATVFRAEDIAFVTPALGEFEIDRHDERPVGQRDDLAVGGDRSLALIEGVDPLAPLRRGPRLPLVFRAHDVDAVEYPLLALGRELEPGGVIAAEHGVGQENSPVGGLPESGVPVVFRTVDRRPRLRPGPPGVLRDRELEAPGLADVRRAGPHDRQDLPASQADGHRKVAAVIHDRDALDLSRGRRETDRRRRRRRRRKASWTG